MTTKRLCPSLNSKLNLNLNLSQPVSAWRSGVCLAAALLPAALQAEEIPDRLGQTGWIQLGVFRANINSRTRVDQVQTGVNGTDVSFEDDLGLIDHKNLPAVLLGLRLGGNWRAEFEYFKLNRNASISELGEPIRFGNTTYETATAITTDFASKVYRLSGGYSFYRTSLAEFGAVLGVHVTDFNVQLRGVGTVNGTVAATRSEQQKKTVPLPTLGIYGSYAFAPSWVSSGRIDVLSLKVRDYEGELINIQANLLYRLTPNFAVGLGYRYDDYSLKADRADWNGNLKYTFSGPQLFVDAGF